MEEAEQSGFIAGLGSINGSQEAGRHVPSPRMADTSTFPRSVIDFRNKQEEHEQGDDCCSHGNRSVTIESLEGAVSELDPGGSIAPLCRGNLADHEQRDSEELSSTELPERTIDQTNVSSLEGAGLIADCDRNKQRGDDDQNGQNLDRSHKSDDSLTVVCNGKTQLGEDNKLDSNLDRFDQSDDSTYEQLPVVAGRVQENGGETAITDTDVDRSSTLEVAPTADVADPDIIKDCVLGPDVCADRAKYVMDHETGQAVEGSPQEVIGHLEGDLSRNTAGDATKEGENGEHSDLSRTDTDQKINHSDAIVKTRDDDVYTSGNGKARGIRSGHMSKSSSFDQRLERTVHENNLGRTQYSDMKKRGSGSWIDIVVNLLDEAEAQSDVEQKVRDEEERPYRRRGRGRRYREYGTMSDTEGEVQTTDRRTAKRLSLQPSLRYTPKGRPSSPNFFAICHQSESPVQQAVSRTSSPASSDSEGEHASTGSYQMDERSKITEEEGTKLTKTQILTFLTVAISTFLDQVSFSVLAPFFPREARDKGVSSLQVGFIFGAFALVNVIFSPIFGKFLPRLGAKFTFVSGIWIVAGCNILFGFCDMLKSTFLFTLFSYLIRCTAAVGTAGGVTASMAIIANSFPNHVAQAVGMLETFSGLGYMVGPVIGGFLYEISGNDFKMPFIVLGGVDLVFVLISMALLPPINCSRVQPGSIGRFLAIPSVWPVGLVIFVGSGAFGFLDPTLSLHVEQFTRSAMAVGLLFLLAGGCYALGSPVWAWLAERLNISRLLVILGAIMSGGAFLLMGPSPLLNLPNELWIISLSLFLAGTFLSASIISSFNDFLQAALQHNLPDDLSTQAIVSGVFNSIFAFGYFVGPSVGGVAVETFGFDWSATVLAGLQIAVAIVLALFTLGQFCCKSGVKPSPLPTQVMASVNHEDLVQDSMEPLLKGAV